jgi:hypothetical protein
VFAYRRCINTFFVVLLLCAGAGPVPLYAGGSREQGPLKPAVPNLQQLPQDRESGDPDVVSVTSITNAEFAENPETAEAEGLVAAAGELATAAGELAATATNSQSNRAETVMKALAQGYPDRVGPAEFRDGDWAAKVRGQWFYYAEGRLLPQELRSKAAEYDPQPFYRYSAELPPWVDPTAEESARIRTQSRQRSQHPPKRSQHFHDALWRASSRTEAWDRVKSLRFLGHPVYVHYSILEELALVEELILEEAKTNAQVRQWINNISTLDGWNWRSIADTQSRSFHAYGAAFDLLPKSLGKLETYWLWASRNRSDWWAVPYSQRLHPPEAVIKAFESYGFVWGGKWMFYDTMHFEYRPEIFILSGLPLSTLQ